MKQALSIDIGGTSVKYAWVNQEGMLSERGSFLTVGIHTIDEFLAQLEPIVIHAIGYGIADIGISSLGVFDEAGYCLGGVENLAFLEHQNLSQLLKNLVEPSFRKGLEVSEKEIHVSVMNDGAAAAMGEYWIGEGQGCNNYICITLGTGIGGAIVLDGRPVLGSHFRSGEIGYSNYISEKDYVEQHYSTQGILDKADLIDGYAFIELVKKQDQRMCKIFQEWMDVIGKLIANMVLLLDPEKVIIGGGISAQKELLIPALTETMNQHLPEGFRGQAAICTARNGNDSGILGAVWQYFK